CVESASRTLLQRSRVCSRLPRRTPWTGIRFPKCSPHRTEETMAQKLTADQARRVEEIEAHLKTVEHLKHLITELDGNRAGAARLLQGICESIAREAGHLRQRCISSNIGTVADVAGAMSVMAGRGGGINLKIRGLNDAANSLVMQLEHALKMATAPDPSK